MKLFKCQNCGQILYSENSVREKCSHSLGYNPAIARLLALEPMPGQENVRQAVGAPERSYRFCSNASFGVCNWLIDTASPDAFCLCLKGRPPPCSSRYSTPIVFAPSSKRRNCKTS